ncbi:hypothetical protein PGT21_028232 [Puccinia graminis f. sp. tritici]|uniref:Uncharacterized protein n=1 Tax=Puccinia graminis f. sp. tritici TaxID=56615 RepID=A0A5B0P6Z4_PUCGR|nr:hypothetical protein PGTUg99_012738 [Puccinia graminis f. sp. tritici]KAA1104618.1 hypothetical protein PGT21_028232 [Puccinia graminis f. sp. tritici]
MRKPLFALNSRLSALASALRHTSRSHCGLSMTGNIGKYHLKRPGTSTPFNLVDANISKKLAPS